MEEIRIEYDVEGYYGVSRTNLGKIKRQWKIWIPKIPESHLDTEHPPRTWRGENALIRRRRRGRSSSGFRSRAAG